MRSPAIAAALLFVHTIYSGQATTAPASKPLDDPHHTRDLCNLNAARTKANLAPLAWEPRLWAVAKVQALIFAQTNAEPKPNAADGTVLVDMARKAGVDNVAVYANAIRGRQGAALLMDDTVLTNKTWRDVALASDMRMFAEAMHRNGKGEPFYVQVFAGSSGASSVGVPKCTGTDTITALGGWGRDVAEVFPQLVAKYYGTATASSSSSTTTTTTTTTPVAVTAATAVASSGDAKVPTASTNNPADAALDKLAATLTDFRSRCANVNGKTTAAHIRAILTRLTDADILLRGDAKSATPSRLLQTQKDVDSIRTACKALQATLDGGASPPTNGAASSSPSPSPVATPTTSTAAATTTTAAAAAATPNPVASAPATFAQTVAAATEGDAEANKTLDEASKRLAGLRFACMAKTSKPATLDMAKTSLGEVRRVVDDNKAKASTAKVTAITTALDDVAKLCDTARAKFN